MQPNPYLIQEPSIISFSGGKTSAFMLYQILQAHGGKIPKDCHVVFANTGKEMPQTLDFINKCSENWNVKIVWLELSQVIKEGYKPSPNSRDWIFKYKETNIDDCAKNGEPFEILIEHYGKLPNATNRFCTYLMKQRAIAWYENVNQLGNPNHILGLRYDEPHRVHRVKQRKDKRDILTPLYNAKHTKIDIDDFWKKSNFALDLEYLNGHTVFGNCDMCFLKGKKQLEYMIDAKPKLADWWIEQENKTGKTFKYDISFNQIKTISLDNKKNSLFNFDHDESIDCFCHD